MGSVQHKILVILIFLLCQFVYSNDLKDFEGVWRSQHSNNSNEDSYIAISKINNNTYFVLFVSPYWNHQLDYSEYGDLNKDGYIVIKTEDAVFYLELNEKGYLYHNWNFIYDFNANRFEKMADKETMEKRSRVPEISIEDFNDFIRAQEENQDE